MYYARFYFFYYLTNVTKILKIMSSNDIKTYLLNKGKHTFLYSLRRNYSVTLDAHFDGHIIP